MTAHTAKPSKAYKGIGMNGLIATWYAGMTRKNLAAYREYAQRVADNTPKGAAVLEVAPGPGYLAIELAKLGSYRITGLDISAKFVEIAQTNARADGVAVDFRQGNAAEMPFEEGAFDFIVCTAAFKNFSEPVRALNEMHRVLKPAGRALIIDLRGDVTPEEVERHIDRDLHLAGINAWITKQVFRRMLIRRAYTKEQFRAMIASSRFGAGDVRDDAIGQQIWLQK